MIKAIFKKKGVPDGTPLPDSREATLLLVLAIIQFTHILDFMIVMPLGPTLMQKFRIGPAEFGQMVSVYTFSAGLFGLVAAWFVDRFDRKKALLFCYAGFALGTLACALSPTFSFLMLARFIAGGFGGVSGAMILAIVGDVIPGPRRGAAMGTIFTSFSVASIAGVPAGLFLANHLGWHAPFFLLAGLSAVILFSAGKVLPSLRTHISSVKSQGAWKEMQAVLGHVNHWRAFALTMVMTLAGFLVIPYISPSLVANVGIRNESLPFIYLCGGFATFFSMRWVGRMGDRHGLLRIFVVASFLTMVPLLAISNLPHVPLWVALIITTFFMIFSSSRMVPGMAMVTNSVEPRYRGGFMSINSAFQQFSMGVAAWVAGMIIVRGTDDRLLHYGIVGTMGAVAIIVSLFLARWLMPEDPSAGA